MANRLRSHRLAVELEAMAPMRVERLPEYTESEVGVSSWSRWFMIQDPSPPSSGLCLWQGVILDLPRFGGR